MRRVIQDRLLDLGGKLSPKSIGWRTLPNVDCNTDLIGSWKHGFRLKKWDYYGVFYGGNPAKSFFSATIADLGYAVNCFVYLVDLQSNTWYEEGVVEVPMLPLTSYDVDLTRNSVDLCKEGEGESPALPVISHFKNKKVSLIFSTSMVHHHLQNEQQQDAQNNKHAVCLEKRELFISWPSFHGGKGISAKLTLQTPINHDSMNIVIPINEEGSQFYMNRKINCMEASGNLQYGDRVEDLEPESASGCLDWGRGVWNYHSEWNWASASGFLPDQRRIGLNLGCGFGIPSAPNEDAVIVDHRLHKIGPTRFEYSKDDLMQPWRFQDQDGRLDLTFTPQVNRTAKTNLGVINSEVHQLFGRYDGRVITDDQEEIEIRHLVGFAEEHYAKW